VVSLLPRTVHALLVLQVLLLHLLLDVLQGLTRISPDLTRLVLNVKLMLLYPLLPLLVILVVEFTLNEDLGVLGGLQFFLQFKQGQRKFSRLAGRTCGNAPF
jgi:hypothetical protein